MSALYPQGQSPNRIGLAGDWHGNSFHARAVIEHFTNRADVIIQLGDFGFWTPGPAQDKFISRVNRALNAADLMLVFVDGNHEFHPGLAKLPIDDDTGLRKVTNRIWHAPRGHRWEWSGVRWMALGGAYSIDRQWRTEGKDWWPEERLTDADVETACTGGSVDVLVSHDAPLRARVPLMSGSKWPSEDVRASRDHRALVQKVVDAAMPSRVWHGHFHCHYEDLIGLPDGQACQVFGLDCDGTKLWQSTRVVDAHGAPLTAQI